MVHQSGSVLRNRGEQAPGDADVRCCQFQHRVQLYPGRPFHLKFMTVIHTAYMTIKMPGPMGVITLKSDQRDALACENVALTHAGRFSKEEAQKLVAKVAKTRGGGTPAKTVMPGPSAGGTSKTHVAKQKQSMTVTPASTQRTTNQLVADERKGGHRQRDSGGPYLCRQKVSYQYLARSQIGNRAHLFSPSTSGCVCMADIRYA
jgi:hypothetical protein